MRVNAFCWYNKNTCITRKIISIELDRKEKHISPFVFSLGLNTNGDQIFLLYQLACLLKERAIAYCYVTKNKRYKISWLVITISNWAELGVTDLIWLCVWATSLETYNTHMTCKAIISIVSRVEWTTKISHYSLSRSNAFTLVVYSYIFDPNTYFRRIDRPSEEVDLVFGHRRRMIELLQTFLAELFYQTLTLVVKRLANVYIVLRYLRRSACIIHPNNS